MHDNRGLSREMCDFCMLLERLSLYFIISYQNFRGEYNVIFCIYHLIFSLKAQNKQVHSNSTLETLRKVAISKVFHFN